MTINPDSLTKAAESCYDAYKLWLEQDGFDNDGVVAMADAFRSLADVLNLPDPTEVSHD